jgi:hypothetical protein
VRVLRASRTGSRQPIKFGRVAERHHAANFDDGANQDSGGDQQELTSNARLKNERLRKEAACVATSGGPWEGSA